MDPKQGVQKPLAPDLQQAYDRVMGLDVTGNPQSSTSQTESTTPFSPIPGESPIPTGQPTPPMPSIPNEPTSPAPGEPSMPPVPPAAGPTPLSTMPDLPVTQPPMPPTMPSTAIPSPSMESLSAAVAIPQVIPQDTETVKIGLGGSPIGSAKPKGKGISPVILIFGAFAFLIIYALFWARFFNYPLPFLPK